MKAKVRFKVVLNNGTIKKLTVEYNCPNFNVIEGGVFLNHKCSNISIKEQIDSWVSDINKKDWMEENDVSTIIDWEVVDNNSSLPANNFKLTNSEMVGLWLKNSNMSDGLKNEFIAVYKEMKPTIKNLKFDKQIEITFKSLNVGFSAASQAYKSLDDIRKEVREDYKTLKE